MFDGTYSAVGRSAAQIKEIIPGNQVVKIHQREWEFFTMCKILASLKATAVLEIGREWGGSLVGLSAFVANGATLVSVDIADPSRQAAVEQAVAHIRAKRPDICLHLVNGNSQDPKTLAKVKTLLPKLDFLFIDASHLYDDVRRDFITYGSLVRPGGIIALHDVLFHPMAATFCQVEWLWRDICYAGYKVRTLCASPTQGSMGIGLVYIDESNSMA